LAATYSSDAAASARDQDDFASCVEFRVLGVDGRIDITAKTLGKLEGDGVGVGVHGCRRLFNTLVLRF
jgi:hypothetical protein